LKKAGLPKWCKFCLEPFGLGAGDPLAALVLYGAHRADRVMIKGRWTVGDASLVGVDVARLRKEHGAAVKLL
jgi:8-oxoguanine deaminase